MKKFERVFTVVAFFCASFSTVACFMKGNYGEANAWLCASLWILISIINESDKNKYKRKVEVIEELVNTVKDEKELGSMVKELHS
jgi:hypothetical protein